MAQSTSDQNVEEVPVRKTIMEQHGYKIGNVIGHGSYAKVKLAHSETHGGVVAIKEISKTRTPSDYLKNFLPREIEVVRGLVHPNLIRFYSSIETTHRVYIIMEYAENGSLIDVIHREKKLTENKTREYLKQIVSVVEFIHSKGIAHRDIKCENLLFNKENVLKLIDFGFARGHLEPTNLSDTFCGSYAYASPEILRGIKYQPFMSDIWAIGIVLYVMLVGRLPFDDSSVPKLQKLVMMPVTYPDKIEVSKEAKHLVQSILLPVNKRLNLDGIKQDPWYLIEPKEEEGT